MTAVDVYRANRVLIILVFTIKTTRNKLRADNFQKTKIFVKNPKYRTNVRIACSCLLRNKKTFNIIDIRFKKRACQGPHRKFCDAADVVTHGPDFILITTFRKIFDSHNFVTLEPDMSSVINTGVRY